MEQQSFHHFSYLVESSNPFIIYNATHRLIAGVKGMVGEKGSVGERGEKGEIGSTGVMGPPGPAYSG